MKNILTFFLLLLATIASSQSIQDLEEQLKTAESSKERMILSYQIGEAYLRTDAKKALEYGKKAHDLATQTKNDGMAAQSAYLTALAYERNRDERNEEVWLRTTLAFAKKVGDSDLIIKSVEKRSRLATKERNYRKAYGVVEEAFEYFSQKGTSISDLESKYDLQKTQLEREKRHLEQERERLQSEIDILNNEKNLLSTDRDRLAARQNELVKAKEKVEQEISDKDERLATVSEQKQQAEALVNIKEKELKELSREALEKQAALDAVRANQAEIELGMQRDRTLRNYSIIGAAFLVVLVLLFYGRYRAKRKTANTLAEKNKVIEEERKRSDDLLRNILPGNIAAELKEFGKAKARKFSEVTVLFSDFKNFTYISEQLSPEELVQELDKCFKAFDFIISQYEDIEKIKTIGDAYMCASGLTERKTLPTNIVKAALEMQEFLNEQKQERMRLGKPYFEARIGIHTGPVVAGVVGVNKFAYDIWGDTVNIASRMEVHSEAGRINISETTYGLIKYNFDCVPRGKVEVKNKGAVDMYYVKGELNAVTA